MSVALAGGSALGPAERLHPFYLLTGLGGALRGAWGLVAGGAVFAANGQWWLVALMAAGFVLLSVGSLVLNWLKFEYRVGRDELRIDQGFLSRTSRVIPFERVTDVDLEQGPLHRLLGLARVRLETGGSAGGKNEEGVLHTIALDRAEALREHVRARRGQAAPAAAEEDQAIAEPLFAMDSRRVLTAGLFNFSLAVLAALVGFTQTFGDALDFDPFRRRFWLDLLDRAEPLRALVLAHQLVAVIAGAMLLLLLGFATGIGRTLLREHGFRLDRTDTGLRRRRGLATLTDVSIPARRVQAAILATGPVRRRFGWWVLKLQSLAQDGARGDHVVAPLAREGEAGAILATLGWQTAPAAYRWRRVSRAFLAAAAALAGVALLAAAIAFPFDPELGLVILAGGLAAIAVRRLAWARTRYAFDRDALFIATGWWRHRRSMIPLAKVQSVDLAQSAWGRLFGICTLRLGIAGGGGFSDHHVPALPYAEAEALRLRLLA